MSDFNFPPPSRRPRQAPESRALTWIWLIIFALLLVSIPTVFFVGVALEDPKTAKKAPTSASPPHVGGSIVLFVAGLIVGSAIYFAPSFIAAARHHHNALAIFMLNLLLGWTFLAWCVAMVWSCTEVKK